MAFGVGVAALEITPTDNAVVKGGTFPIGKDAVFGSHFIYYNKEIYHLPGNVIERIKKVQPPGRIILPKYEQKDFARCAFDIFWERMGREGDACFKDGNILDRCNRYWEPAIGIQQD